ncbi:RsmD family RNA methyltransferase [Rariglobus hedericola]|uniref:Methyltransferase n=1 Tax=Rariglobus hedericola TaxID=2597822 RepID=A0A556QRX6_9BACT|nr:RsmD family RNA methyltransferase [Rariglobus hedericola]TSJ79394.1 methyltransferase [Rariglobus hedericola]
MRISGGAARGVTLQVPKGDVTRPATDGMRQAVFSSLAARLPGARFVDLFAGSGAYGLEAFSRGAQSGVFVEKNPRAADCIRKNITTVAKSAARQADNLKLLAMDVLTWEPAAGEAPDLVFIDPPYEVISDVGPKLFARMACWWSTDADPVVVFEMPGEVTLEPPAGWECVKRLGKGARQPTTVFFRRTAML